MGTAYGRHVVVSFDDVVTAEEFVAALKVEGALFYQDAGGHFKHINPADARVSGMFGKPNQFCECSWSGGEKKYVRGSKYGLYVHDKCLKPEGGHLQSAPRDLLLPADIGPRERVEREGYIGISVREGKRNWPEPKPKEA